jgi:hypothetical protein
MCNRGVRKQPVQFVDVHDLAEWTIRVAEQRTTGEFNTSGPVDHHAPDAGWGSRRATKTLH